MALPAREDFAGSAAALGGSWTQARPTDGTVDKDGSGKGKASAVNIDPVAWWNADTFSSDQSSQGVVTSIVTGAQTVAVLVRCSGSTNATSNGYDYQAGDSLYKLVNGTFTLISADPASGSWVTGDTVCLSVVGSGAGMQLKMYRNGVQVGSTQNDTALTSGAPGVHLFASTGQPNTNRIDDWIGDNIPATGSSGVRARRIAMQQRAA